MLGHMTYLNPLGVNSEHFYFWIQSKFIFFFSMGRIFSGQFITTSAEVTPNGGVVRESSQNGLKLG